MSVRFLSVLVLTFLAGAAIFLFVQPPPPARPPVVEQAAAAPSSPTAKARFMILAASWEPAFCEGAPDKPECASMSTERFDASHFALHGLWPRDEYCGVSSTLKQTDKNGRWSSLPPVELEPAATRLLAEVMPGTRSQLERHEWIKHGTCFGAPPAQYFTTAILLMGALNGSPVRDLLAERIGSEVTQSEIRAAFDRAFGPGAGQRVRIACKDDGSRRLISEITIGLFGTFEGAPNLGNLVMAAKPTEGGCEAGVVDPVGPQ